MKLNLQDVFDLEKKDEWEKSGIKLPKFSYEKIKANTQQHPKWVHFGAGNIFRGFVARAYQELLNEGDEETGIIAVETFDTEVIDKIYTPYDQLALVVLMNSDGSFDQTVVASVVEGITTQKEKGDYARLEKAFIDPSLQMASFTITEKGYALKDFSGNYFPFVVKDIEGGPESATHAMSVLTALMYQRYKAGKYPISLVSMDNCSHNGDKIKAAVLDLAKEWMERGFVEEGFLGYVSDPKLVAYPLSMIDKITPRPAEIVKEALEKSGLEEMDIVVTSKNTYMAPFVNAEVCEYLVIEDWFPNGRPKLEKAGFLFCDRDTVNKVETMKVTTCLNPLHTALAVTGCLLGYTLIADEMKDPSLKKLVEIIGYEEGLPVVVHPGIIDPKQFIDEVVNLRLTNPFIPDTPQRIATDTSQKVGIRYGITIQSYSKKEEDRKIKENTLIGIPLAIAAWCRYLLGVDDEGRTFELSSDPMMKTLQETIGNIHLGDTVANLEPILSNEAIFGQDLYQVGLGKTIEDLFLEMIQGPHAVRQTLNKYLLG